VQKLLRDRNKIDGGERHDSRAAGQENALPVWDAANRYE
jgi:hypothetical protein